MKYLGLSLSLFLLSACSNYNLLVNDNLLYSPPSLFLSFSVRDQNLEGCLVQHIEDRGITARQDLRQVNCSYAGITSLEGLAIFGRIESLSLKGNPISDLEAIFQMGNLRSLDISETEVSCETLVRLEDLLLDQLVSTAQC